MHRPTALFAALLLPALACAAGPDQPAGAAHVSTATPFAKGDILVAATLMDNPDDDHGGTGRLIQYDANLKPKGELYLTGTRHKVGGLTFAPDRTLWAFSQLTPAVVEIGPDAVQRPMRSFSGRKYSSVTFGRDGSLYFGEHMMGTQTGHPSVTTKFSLLPGRDVIGDGHVFRHAADGRLLDEFATRADGGMFGFLAVTSTVLTDGDRRLIYVSETGKRVMQYDLAGRRQLPDLADLAGNPDIPMVLVMNPTPDGRLLISTGKGFFVMDPKSGAVIRNYPLDGMGWAAVNSSADGQFAIIGNFFTGDVVKVRLADGAIVARNNVGQKESLSGIAEFPGMTGRQPRSGLTRRQVLAGGSLLAAAGTLAACSNGEEEAVQRPAGVPLGPYGAESTAEQVVGDLDLRGRTALITGANSGLGYETMRVLALRGAHVIGVARTREKAEQACADFPGRTTPVAMELTDFPSLVQGTNEVKALGRAIDMLILNAGIMALPELEQVYGLEKQFVTNHLGHFIVGNRLLPEVQRAPQGRVVVLTSSGYQWAPAAGIEFDNLSGERDYEPNKMYGQSKLANHLYARELARRLAGTTTTANSVHPGVIMTNLGRNFPEWKQVAARLIGWTFMKSVEAGAATTCYVATAPDLAKVTGQYFADCNPEVPGGQMQNDELAAKLWQASEDLTREYLLT